MLAKYQGRQWTFVFLVAFLASSFIASLFAVNTTTSLPIASFYLAGGVVFYLAFKAGQHNKYRKYAEWFLYLLVAYALVIAAFLVYQHFGLNIKRPRSIVGGTNLAARYIELVIPVLLSLLLYSASSLKRKLLLGAGLALLLGGLLITQTRGALIATGIVATLIMLFYKSYRLLGASIILMPLILYAEKSSLNRLIMTLNTEASSNIERMNVWVSSLRIISDYPLTGVGFGNFEQIYVHYILPSAKLLPHAHNILLIFATEAGLFTAVFFILFVLFATLALFNGLMSMSAGYYRSLVVGMNFGAVAILINGMVDHSFHQLAVWMIFLFEIGFSLALCRS